MGLAANGETSVTGQSGTCPSHAAAASSRGSSADVVTFLLTDIEGSSLRWLHHRAAMQEALREHDRILSEAVTGHGGRVFKTTGDGLYAAFDLPADAVNAAADAQQALATRDWSAVGGLAVRMALHVGTAELRNADYFGPAMNRAARLLPLAHGGQILVTAALAEMVASERDSGHAFRRLGAYPLDDPLQPVGVLQVEGPGLRRDFPSPRSADARPTNLPRQLAPLIGRDADRERLLALLRKHALVTVTGSGGVGKTRLAVDAAAARLSEFAQGAWMIELAPISDPCLVAGAVASTLEISLSPDQPPQKALAARLRTQELLLLIDNCEHVVEAAGRVIEGILSNAPKVRVLATSQEPLGLAGEHVMRLSSLAVPRARQLAAADALHSGAVRLFVDRARAADANFVLDDRNASIVAAVCRRLDGIPLAIEMAAARVPLLGVDLLARKLDERFRILASGRRTALPRQQTVEASPKRGLAAFETALALPRDAVEPLTRASLYRSYAIALVLTGRTDEASAALAEAMTLAEHSRVPRLVSEIITTRASIRLPAGDLPGARSDQEIALALFRGAAADRSALNTLGNLADADWAMGNLADAIAGFREAAARLCKAPIVHDDLLAVTLGNLVGALTEQGNLEEARSVAREALPLLRDDETAWLWFDHFALLAAECDRIEDAARLAGYAEAALVAHERVRQPNEMRARASLDAVLRDRLPADTLERLLAEGALLSEEDACRLALSEPAVAIRDADRP